MPHYRNVVYAMALLSVHLSHFIVSRIKMAENIKLYDHLVVLSFYFSHTSR